MNAASDALEVNGRSYRAPAAPVVVVCIDGSEADYHEQTIAAGLIPNLAELPEHGTSLVGDCTMPSFTNPNNRSWVRSSVRALLRTHDRQPARKRGGPPSTARRVASSSRWKFGSWWDSS
ncbi:hypothetical protein [Saccharopolyspora sp. NPDC002376]